MHVLLSIIVGLYHVNRLLFVLHIDLDEVSEWSNNSNEISMISLVSSCFVSFELDVNIKFVIDDASKLTSTISSCDSFN